MKKFRALSCLVFALCLVFYAVPRLPVQVSELATGFSLAWIAFALLVIGSNLFFVLGSNPSRTSTRSLGRTIAYARGSSPRKSSGSRKRRITIDH
ncbi:hypothetical protein [Ammoniphilus sp. CFH 90114]|uniref:hypothetical protein n=1 Tax=Ammoniphilus sp. CFH 90114 TaxID=2493665 RepID=UPI00100E6476|nr:hypothetical protein [Ammoniphilus sp. CFH 90114]RXT04800.1 hypothetical protein EIZ39_18915 [Ammoniphilus sp. CFH 90114]